MVGTAEVGQKHENCDDDLSDSSFSLSETKICEDIDNISLVEPRKSLKHKFPSMFPDCLNEKLKDEVDGLRCENIRLKRTLQEAEKKLIELKPVMDLPSPLRGLGRSSDLAASKIVELSKKVRELNAKLGSAQSKANSAEAQLSVYMASTKCMIKEEPKEEDPTMLEQKEVQVKELQEKLSNSNNKLCETRNHVQQLKHELKMCQKVLVSEVGDDVTVQTALSSTGTWRGRAQQIINLQKKVSELSTKLSCTDIPMLERNAISSAANERHADKEKMNALNRELEGLNGELLDTRSKLDAARARIKVLTSELGVNKVHITNYTVKSEQDDQMINRLTNQLSGMMERAKEREEALSKSLRDRISDLSIELNQEKAKTDQLKEIISDLEGKLARMECKLNDSKNCDMRTSGPMVDLNEMRPISRASSFDRQSSNSGSFLQTSEAERLRMMELVSVLNKRLENERKTLERVQEDLRKERHRGAKLETKLARLEMEKISCSRGSVCSSVYQKACPPKSGQSTITATEMETVKDKCELLQEKCFALETRLETLRQEKEEETRMYMNIIEETRQSVKDHYRIARSPSSSSML